MSKEKSDIPAVRDLEKIAEELSKFEAQVGYFGGDPRKDAPITNTFLAYIHTQGIGNPKRDFLEFDETDIQAIDSVIGDAVNKYIGGTYNIRDVYNHIGVKAKTSLQAGIHRKQFAPLTSRQGTPLWDTGQMISAMKQKTVPIKNNKSE